MRICSDDFDERHPPRVEVSRDSFERFWKRAFGRREPTAVAVRFCAWQESLAVSSQGRESTMSFTALAGETHVRRHVGLVCVRRPL